MLNRNHRTLNSGLEKSPSVGKGLRTQPLKHQRERCQRDKQVVFSHEVRTGDISDCKVRAIGSVSATRYRAAKMVNVVNVRSWVSEPDTGTRPGTRSRLFEDYSKGLSLCCVRVLENCQGHSTGDAWASIECIHKT